MSDTNDWPFPPDPHQDPSADPTDPFAPTAHGEEGESADPVGAAAASDRGTPPAPAEPTAPSEEGETADPVGGGGVGDELATDEAIAAMESAERVRDASKRAIEALVMVAEEPLASNLLGQLLEVSPVVVDRLCEELAAAYEDEGRGFQLVRVAGGWRYQSHPDQSAYVERFVLQGQTAKLSVAALETLAIVAYKQPVSRAQVASIRGVSVDGVMRTLEQRGYIAEVGKDPGPGQAVLFGTTPLFLEKVGLDNIDELPPLGDFVPGADVVEQLEQGLRPDRMPLRPEDAMAAGDGPGPGGDGGFDLLAGMGEIAGIHLSDDDRRADTGGAAGDANGSAPTNGHGPHDDGRPESATASFGGSVWDLHRGGEAEVSDVVDDDDVQSVAGDGAEDTDDADDE
jgi:segregation and condensation protein B